MNKKETLKNLKYIKDVLSHHLGELVIGPLDKEMYLVELYSNGNVGVLPPDYWDYDIQLKEFHAESIKIIREYNGQ